MMNTITVKCSNKKCGKYFQTQNIFGGVNSTVSFKDCHIGVCPRCFSPGIINTTFKFDSDGVMSVLSRPEFTEEVLFKLQHVAEVAQSEFYSPEKFKEQATSIGIPDVFFKLVIPQDAGDFYSFLQFLILLIPKLMRSKSRPAGSTQKKKKKSAKKKKRNQDLDSYNLRRDYNKSNR